MTEPMQPTDGLPEPAEPIVTIAPIVDAEPEPELAEPPASAVEPDGYAVPRAADPENDRQEAAAEPAIVAAVEPEPEPVAEAVVQPEVAAVEPEPEPVAEPVAEAVVQPEVAAVEPEPEPVAEAVVQPEVAAVEPEPEPVAEPVVEAEVAAAEPEPETPAPSPGPTPVPSPAMFARSHGAPAHSAYGRVDAAGIVYVRTADGEREVGSYPGASNAEALAYFGRKYDELAASLGLLHQRVTQTEITAKEAAEALGKLTESVTEARVVGDLPALDARIAEIGAAIGVRREAESAARAEAKSAAMAQREALVAEAEQIAGQPQSRVQWKSSGARMRELLDEWKAHQRSGPRIDKEAEAGMWQRFSAARNRFDKARKTHFAALDAAHSDARSTKESLATEAERLANSTDWASTAGAFKRLMDEWRTAGRAGRTEDDALWARFKAAQDRFFAAKDAVVAAEEEGFRGNLKVKEGLLAEAEGLLPVTDLEKAKSALRVIQDKWDRAGKVPRADMERIERALRRVEQTVRDAEDRKWSSSNPEAAARASSLVEQLEKAVAGLEGDLAAAQASGNARKVAEAQAALDARRQWLAQARSGLAEFGGR